MLTIKKLWNILNHAGKPWQVSLAVSLAMIVGFTPFLSLHNIAVFLLVFILNIHFGMFLIATAFFSAIGYIFDPLFHSIGLGLLTSDALNSIWTSFYNNPIFKITNFNNSIVLGSLVVSLILFIPVMKLVSSMLVKYREKLAVKFKNIPILNRLEYFKQEEASEVKVVRLAGLGFFVGFIGLIALIKGLYFDEFIKKTIEKNISANSDKIVKIGSIDSSILLSSKIVVNSLMVNDKKDEKNNISIDKIEIDFELSKLLLKKLIVENIAIVNITFPNMRTFEEKPQKVTTSKDAKKESSKQDLRDIANLGKMDFSNTQDILNSDIKQKVEQLKEYYKKIKPLFNSQSSVKETTVIHTRSNGSWVKFKDISALPDLLVYRGAFSITYDNETYFGKLKDFSTNQIIYQKPFKVSLSGDTELIKDLNVEFSTIRTRNADEDKFGISFASIDLDDYTKDKISFSNTKLKGDFSLVVVAGEELFGQGKFDVLNTDINIKSSNSFIGKFNDKLKKIDDINALVDIDGTMDEPKIKLKSNMEKVLRTKLKDVIKSEQKELKNKLRKKVEDKIKKKLDGKIEKKLQEKLGNGLEDKLKGIFKF